MNSIQANDDDTSKFLRVLENISHEQANICALLDELVILMRMPSEDVLRVLDYLLRPMNQSMESLQEQLKEKV